MNSRPPPPPPPSTEATIKSILEWLALAHGRPEAETADQLYRQVTLLREAAVPTAQRIKLLDLLYSQAERIVRAELPLLREIALPVSRKIRHRVRTLLDLLATLTQDYFNSLAVLFDPQGNDIHQPPQTSLRRVMHCLSWQVQISHLVASPPSLGVWQQMHAAFRSARRLGLHQLPGPRAGRSIEEIYTALLLAAIAQPASFCSEEQEFIRNYIEALQPLPPILDSPEHDGGSIFWIDPDKDFPAHALIRRIPSADVSTLYFTCDGVANTARQHLDALEGGTPASALNIPLFAETRTGRGILRRLEALWGRPGKRKFPRRRQSYRVHLCAGLDKLWSRLQNPSTPGELSEWMVTNESPDGYALMHVSGSTHDLRVGDIAAIQPIGERAETTPFWQVCIVRWALSENPEHIELGLQLLAPRAQSAMIAQPQELDSGKIAALVLPETPPLRPSASLVVPTGALRNEQRKIIVILEQDNLEIREVRSTGLDERTSSIEVFSVSADETP